MAEAMAEAMAPDDTVDTGNNNQDEVDGRILKRNTRLNSQDQNQNETSAIDLLDPNVAALRKAIKSLDSNEIDELAKKGLWTAHTVVTPEKFRNPLHTLAVQYASTVEITTVDHLGDLNKKFQECVTVMLENGVDINEGDIARNTPLHLLAQHCGVDAAIQTLIEAGSRVNKKNTNEQTPLHLACDEGTVKEVDAILRGGADPDQLDSSCMSALHYAVKYRRNTEVIKLLIESNASVDVQKIGIRNKASSPAPLHTAVRNNRKENVKLLLEQDANPDVEDSSGQTPLHLAASYDITGSITEMLLQRSASVDHKDAVYGETALHKAIRRNMVKNVKALCDGKASLSTPDLNGESPLHRAAICCHDMEIWVTLLSAEQADIRVRNGKAQTVLERAMKASNKLATAVLKQIEG